MNKMKKIVFENGREFIGHGFGADVEMVSEAVFNTNMVGYQELISDPAYFGQMVVLTYPIIGSYGITDEDFESKTPNMGGLIVGDYNDKPSNYRYTRTLSDVMSEYGLPGITGLDTRAITLMLRDEGEMKVIITDVETTKEEALAKIAAYVPCENPVSVVACKKMWHKRTPNYSYNVVAIDCGIKNSMIRAFNNVGCNVTIVPPTVTLEEIAHLEADGLFIGGGPGAPEKNENVIEIVKALWGKMPIFGVALGHQIVCLSKGANIYKLPKAYRGGGAVRNLVTGKVELVSQNYAYAVCGASLENTGLAVTFENVLDKSVAGVKNENELVMTAQFNPEGGPGSQDTEYLYKEFTEMMKQFKMRGDK